MDQKQTFGRPYPGASVKVAYTGTAGTTTALPETTSTVRVVATTDCFIEIGLSPTAVADTGLYLPAFVPEYFQAQPNAKVSAIQVSAGGTIYCTPI
jgi:hypothetical protein